MSTAKKHRKGPVVDETEGYKAEKSAEAADIHILRSVPADRHALADIRQEKEVKRSEKASRKISFFRDAFLHIYKRSALCKQLIQHIEILLRLFIQILDMTAVRNDDLPYIFKMLTEQPERFLGNRLKFAPYADDAAAAV